MNFFHSKTHVCCKAQSLRIAPTSKKSWSLEYWTLQSLDWRDTTFKAANRTKMLSLGALNATGYMQVQYFVIDFSTLGERSRSISTCFIPFPSLFLFSKTEEPILTLIDFVEANSSSLVLGFQTSAPEIFYQNYTNTSGIKKQTWLSDVYI